ncbi:MAG: hypothetical protein U0V75_15120 [Ferruginibacter sp.]
MKHTVLSYVLLVLCTLTAATAFSQTQGSKPALFNQYPSKISCTQTAIEQLFTAYAGQDISFSCSDNFLFQGKTASNTTKYNSLQTVVIRSAQFADAILVISKITGADHTSTFRGRIINTKYADGYELEQDKSGNYQFVKFETDKLLPDCKQ